MTCSTPPPLLTVPQIARLLGATDRRVDIAVRRAGIPETHRIGITRAYDTAAVELIRAAMAATSRKGGNHAR